MKTAMQRVYDLLSEGGVWTNNEISHRLHMPINCVTPRVADVFRLRYARRPCTSAQCGITGRQAMTWGVRR